MAKDKISYILSQVSDQLMDDGFIRWPKDRLVEYFNDAQRAIAIIRPDSCVIPAEFTCVAGTEQTLPDNGLRLVDVRNTAAGYAIKNRPREAITELYPQWYGTTGSDDPEAFIYDEREPKTFFLFPGVTAGLKIKIVYSATPPVRLVSDVDAGMADLDTVYSTAIIEYMLYKAHSKDFEYSEQAKAQMHYQMFSAILGLKSQGDMGMTPTDKE
ncbi:MAG: DUF6682 family protein [Shewanella sp.]